ncbi:MAG: hypothetical protein KC983_03760, partial [Phycisphaerales bacterium]|nr:hypothetical protein [Phycisphaerales bacterium]
RRLGRHVELEIGAEQQSGDIAGAAELIAFLKAVTQFCRAERYPHPLFCVVQTGTLVREMRNVGLTEGRRNEEFDQKYAVDTMARNVRMLSDVAYINDVFVKEHNGDYLSDGSLATRTEWNIGGVNIAPEFGVFETRTILSLCQEFNCTHVRDELLRIFHDSGKWEKWLRHNSAATDVDKAMIAGHYCFADPEVIALRDELDHTMRASTHGVDHVVREGLIALLRRMTWCLGYQKLSCRPAAVATITTTSSAARTVTGAA